MPEHVLPDREALEKTCLENRAAYAAVLEAFKQEVQDLFQAGTYHPP